MTQNPCKICIEGICDYRRCRAYQTWLNDSWRQFQRFLPRGYREGSGGEEKFVYAHPDVVRRYLERGPCELCEHSGSCRIPCEKYWRWWDARMIWLKWKLRNMEQ